MQPLALRSGSVPVSRGVCGRLDEYNLVWVSNHTDTETNGAGKYNVEIVILKKIIH